MNFPIDYTCYRCGDKASHDFATEEAKKQFDIYWARYHPNEPHASYARTVERQKARREFREGNKRQ